MNPNDLLSKFSQDLQSIVDKHLPSNHFFFDNLTNSDTSIISSPLHLANLYHHYQAAMHSTRVMVYLLPYLNTPALRQRKLTIYIDDDALPNGDTHHMQLYQVFKNLNTDFLHSELIFGDLEPLLQTVDPLMQQFIKTVQELYVKSLGAWCIVELMSADWMQAFYSALLVHYPSIAHEPYFHDCFANHVEERHGQEALELTLTSIGSDPVRYQQTLKHAQLMAEALDLLWCSLNNHISAIVGELV